MSQPKVYLAGPDVFFPDALAIGEKKKAICAQFGFQGVFPLDAPLDFEGSEPRALAYRAFDLMVELMEDCDLIIANMTPFRGPSMDVGTAIEIGYMHGRGKPVFGYTNVTDDYAERVEPDGFFVEPFGLIDNIMVEGSVHRSNAAVIRGSVADAEIYTSLDTFRLCAEHAKEVLAG